MREENKKAARDCDVETTVEAWLRELRLLDWEEAQKGQARYDGEIPGIGRVRRETSRRDQILPPRLSEVLRVLEDRGPQPMGWPEENRAMRVRFGVP